MSYLSTQPADCTPALVTCQRPPSKPVPAAALPRQAHCVTNSALFWLLGFPTSIDRENTPFLLALQAWYFGNAAKARHPTCAIPPAPSHLRRC